MGAGGLDSLRRDLAAGGALIVAGAGVSIAATEDAQVASWLGLLRSGLDRVAIENPATSDKWHATVTTLLDDPDTANLVFAAEKITTALGGRSSGKYARWLKETVGSLSLKDGAVPNALLELGCPIATTNYDGLIEEAAGQALTAITWQDPGLVQEVLRRDRLDRVIHLHGYWEKPSSVVLGYRSYEEILRDSASQDLQRAVGLTWSLMLVGVGQGGQDPNIGALLTWLEGAIPSSTTGHYWICDDAQKRQIGEQHPQFVPVSYGHGHALLAGFLSDLKPSGAGNVAAPASPWHAPDTSHLRTEVRLLLAANTPTLMREAAGALRSRAIALRTQLEESPDSVIGNQRQAFELATLTINIVTAADYLVNLGGEPSDSPGVKLLLLEQTISPAVAVAV